MDLDHNANLLRLVDDGPENLQFFFGRPWDGSKGYFARKLDSHVGHFPYLSASRFRSVIVQPQGAGGDNARSIDDALLDVIPERDVSFRRTAPGQYGRVTGFEKSLHLRLFIGSGIDVPMSIDEAGHGGHAFGVNGLPARRGRFARRHGNDFSCAHYDRAALYNSAVCADDT